MSDAGIWDEAEIFEQVGAAPSGSDRRIVPTFVIGLAAVALVAFFAGKALIFGGSGATSPDGAVRQLATAVSNEDMVAALGALAPEEVGSLVDVYNDATDKAKELGLSGDSTFAGVDLSVDDLELAVEPMGDDLAKVRIRNGTLGWSVDRGGLATNLRELLDERDGTESDRLAVDDLRWRDSHDKKIDPFVMAVRRDGGWYVSAFYTVAEYLVVHDGAAEVDVHADLVANPAASSPSAAVRELVAAVNERDVEKGLATLATPEWAVLRSYRAALSDQLDRATNSQNDGFQISEVELREERLDDSTVKVVVTGASGTVERTTFGFDELGPGQLRRGDGGPGIPMSAPATRTETWTFDGRCIEITGADHQTFGDTLWLFDGTCLGPDGADPLGLAPFSGATLVEPYLVTVQQGDGWAISPVRTVAGYLRDTIASLDGNDLVRLTGTEVRQDPTAELAVGDTVDLSLDSGYVVASLTVEAGTIVQLDATSAGSVSAGVAVYRSPDDDDPLYSYVSTGDRWAAGGGLTGTVTLAPDHTTEYRVVVSTTMGRASDPRVSISVRLIDAVPLTLARDTTVTVGDDISYFEFIGAEGDEVNLSWTDRANGSTDADHFIDSDLRDPDVTVGGAVRVIDLATGWTVYDYLEDDGRYLIAVGPARAFGFDAPRAVTFKLTLTP